MIKYIRSLSFTIVATLVLFGTVVRPTVAGGPLLINSVTGQPFLWPNGGQNIPYNPDQGGLGPLTNAQAVAQTDAAFAQWGSVSTSTASYVNAGPMPFDVDITNFIPLLFFPVLDGLSPIVYDEDGSIFNFLFGFGSGVLGFATPQFANFVTGDILEGIAFLNGGAINAGFPVNEFLSVQVSEFGHYSNLAHTVINAQIVIFGDASGPTPFDTFPVPSLVNKIESMSPFIFINGGQATPNADDNASLSTLYPAASFSANFGSITGTIFAPNGTTKLTGVNVIARNVANPFDDAVSAISSDFTDDFSQGNPLTGVYTLNGLTPGAQYAVYVDEILAGGFSTPPLSPLPGPEEFYNGADESNDPTTDDPSVFAAVTATAGSPATGIDIIFNAPTPGVIPLGDDDFAELPLPFTCEICGVEYNSVFVNSNGSLTFGAGDTDFTESAGEFLGEVPRIAALWDDLSPNNGGVVSFEQNTNKKGVIDEFIVRFEDVPEFFATGANTFEFRIFLEKEKGQTFNCYLDIIYGDMSATDGLAGISCGGADTCGSEQQSDLSSFAPRRINLQGQPAVFELFSFGNPNDLANSIVRFNSTTDFKDNWAEPNDVIEEAREVNLPFDTCNARTQFSEINPTGGDVDYYFFAANAGETLIAEVIGGQLDSLIGIFDFATGDLLDFDDDGGAGLLSRLVFAIPADGEFALAVTTFPDFDFDGNGNSGGRYCLDVSTIAGTLLDLGDDDFEEVTFGFTFPFQGTNYSSVFVNSNGSLTFGSGDTDFTESVGEFLNDQPRIAALWDDLRPPSGGLVIATEESNSLTIEFIGVPEFFSTGSNTFSVTLDSSGVVTIEYGAVSANDALVGITEGNGATDPGETDLSAALSFSVVGTTYERFLGFGGDTFDLSGQTLVFSPP